MENKFKISNVFVEQQKGIKIGINILSLFILVTVISHCNGAQEGDIQLVGATSTKFEGNVFIYHHNKWGIICDDEWSMNNAEVVCRQLRFGGALKATKFNHYRTHKRRIWKDNVKCSGVETKLASCASNPWAIHNCNDKEAAGVKCSPPDNSVTVDVANGVRENDIVPETDRSYSVRSWVNQRLDAMLRQRNEDREENRESELTTTNSRNTQNIGSPPLLPGVVDRINRINRITNTLQVPQRVNNAQTMDSATAHHSSNSSTTSNSLDLAKNDDSRAIHTNRDNHGIFRERTRPTSTSFPWWGFQMGSFQLGGRTTIKPAERPTEKPTTTPSTPATTTVPFKVKPLTDDLYSAAGVKNISIRPEKYEIRLLDGRYSTEGRLEVYHNGKWGTICGKHWGLFETMVACKQLGLGYGRNSIQADFFGGTHLPKHFARIDCTGNEKFLHECSHKEILNGIKCQSSDLVAGVICSKTLPDLVPDMDLLAKSIRLEDRSLYTLQCAMEENCVSDSAYSLRTTYPSRYLGFTRRLLRFSSSVRNSGTADFHPFIPKESWEWHLCHLHYHSMDIFAHYDILDDRGNRVAQGHKASFCLEDTDCSPGVKPKYQCVNYGDQGISVGCADTYEHDIDCQWIDISDLNAGTYTFKVHINPEFKVAELSYDNNAITCKLVYTGMRVFLDECRLGRG